MRKNKTLYQLLLALTIGTLLNCSILYAAGEPGGFMYWGAGARSLGLANASVAAVDDAFATYWNPAVLATLDYQELGTFHALLWEETQFTVLGYAHPTLEKGTFGGSVIRLFSGGAEKRDEFNVQQGTFDHQQIAAGFSYAKNAYKKLHIGASFKYINLSLDTFTQNSFTIDSGFYLPVNENVKFGLNVQNVISAMLSDTDDELPMVFRAGSSFLVLNKKLLIATDLGHKSKNRFIDMYSIGLETYFARIIKARLGRNQDETTAGFGITYMNYTFDYAMALHNLGLSHRISFNIRFGESFTKQRKLKLDSIEIELDELSPTQEAERELMQEQFRESFQMGIGFYKRGIYKQSLENFQKAQKIDPNDPDTPTYIERLQLIAPIIPQNISVDKTSELVRRGITYFVEGNGKAAVKTVAYALSTEPDNFTISRLLNRIEEKTGIKADYSKPASGMSIVDQKLYESLIAFRKKDYSKVIDLCEEVLVLEPENILAYKRLGSAFFALGERDKAVGAWEKALEIKPDKKLEKLIDKYK